MTYSFELDAPWIDWREPIAVNGRWACRICIALHGLKGSEVAALPDTPEQVRDHIAAAHGDNGGQAPA